MRSRSLFLSSLSAVGVLALLGAGCRAGGSSPAPPSTDDPTAIFRDSSGEATTTLREPVAPVATSCNHEYYPLRAGYHIQYRTTYPASMGTSGNGHYSMNVRRVTPSSVYLTSGFEHSDAAPIQSDVEYRCIDGALQAAGYLNMRGVSLDGSAGNYEVHTNRSEGTFLPRNIEVGSVWQATFSITIKPLEGVDSLETLSRPVSMDVVIKRHAIRIERVRVAAGEFEAMNVGTSIAFDGKQVMTGTEWWVKNVGMVKSSFSANGTEVEDILTEAVGYYVPGPGGSEVRSD